MAIEIYSDGASLSQIQEMSLDKRIGGFTTNPTLMRKAGVTDYMGFARKAVELVGSKPISFEVIGDEFAEMNRQARVLSELGTNIFVKIPVINSEGISSVPLVKALLSDGIPVNVTAVFTKKQIDECIAVFQQDSICNLSVFAGRIADTGIDPEPIVGHAVVASEHFPGCKVIWASPREVYNYLQAEKINCHIITMTIDLINKLEMLGKDLGELCLDTVTMFRNDSISSEYRI